MKQLENYKDRMLLANNRYELEMIINELCNELCVIIELLDIRYMEKLVNGIEVARNQEIKKDRIETLVESLKIVGELNIQIEDIQE